ncbi:MAG TPA: hypothetical protein VMH28_32515 [Candidatus Acidoferrales bacterium]|nr:hypothetical protein [Candidatus Acidoferrales bacterium]
MGQEDLILKLARQIDATRKAERFLVDSDAVETLRRQGAAQLHAVCLEFVNSLNAKLTEAKVELSPAAYSLDLFREAGVNLFQITSQGRAMQIAFEATADAVSTEKFAIPHILEGEVRTYNQRMLERSDIKSLLLFYCVERETASWQFFDWRTRSTGKVDSLLLARLMEPLFR